MQCWTTKRKVSHRNRKVTAIATWNLIHICVCAYKWLFYIHVKITGKATWYNLSKCMQNYLVIFWYQFRVTCSFNISFKWFYVQLFRRNLSNLQKQQKRAEFWSTVQIQTKNTPRKSVSIEQIAIAGNLYKKVHKI